MIRLPQPPSIYKLTNALDSARQLFDFSRNLVTALEIQQTQVNRTTQAQTQETEDQATAKGFFFGNNFKNAKADLTSTNNTTIYTCPTATQSVIKSILISNDSGSSDTIDVTLTDASGDAFSLFKAKSVASNTTVELLEQPLIIQESEIIKAQATTADRLHIIISFLEVN